jgi:SAM-dependent methyltransferase
MFSSFKGEGTGAVRPMFSHHILKPERTPLEANLWGTPKSSGSFSTLFKSRILRAIDYCEKPFEIKPIQNKRKIESKKVYGLSPGIGYEIAEGFEKLSEVKPVYLLCGDSADIDIPTESIDAVITDPPFFDNVHYSQLADFFYVWQRYFTSNQVAYNDTTRHPNEVQSSKPSVFAARLQRVFSECHRVLKLDGLMVFTYHHSKADGWYAILYALVKANFAIVATHPIKSEMSVASPKSQAKEPINLDIIIVCRKSNRVQLEENLANALDETAYCTTNQVKRFNTHGRFLSRNDVLVVFMAQLLKKLSLHPLLEVTLDWIEAKHSQIQQQIEDIYSKQSL